MSVEPMRVTIEIEMSALIALIDSESSLADVAGAQRLGLLTKKGDLTMIGGLVLLASDQTFLRHKVTQGAKRSPALPVSDDGI